MRAAPHPEGRQVASGPTSARRSRQLDQRLRRDQRELARQLQKRAARELCPINDDGPLPRID